VLKVLGKEAPYFRVYRRTRIHGANRDYIGIEFHNYDECYPVSQIVPVGEKPGNSASVISRDLYIGHLELCKGNLESREEDKDIYPVRKNWADRIKYLDDFIKNLSE